MFRTSINSLAKRPLFFIAILALLNSGKIIFARDIYWDDNCWFLSLYSGRNLHEFLSTGLYELRRVPQGTLMYYFFSLHKNTDYFYLVGHSVNLLTQVLTPCVLFLFVRNLFKQETLPAVLIAAVSIMYPIDMTLPIFSNSNYRVSLLLTTISFYLTERALRMDIKWSLLVLAAALSAWVQCFMLEAMVAFEPARVFLIGYLFSQKGLDRKTTIKKTAIFSIPFLIPLVPVVYYKLHYKPYGVYEKIYPPDPLFFLRWKLHLGMIKHFLLTNWGYLIKKSIMYPGKYMQQMMIWSLGLSCVGAVLSYSVLKKLPLNEFIRSTGERFGESFRKQWHSKKSLLLLGLLFLVPPVVMYELFGRVPIPGLESRHGIGIQTGFAFVWGLSLYFFLRVICSTRRIGIILISSLIALGVFFNNVNLDIAYDAERKQADFWKAFTRRFPTLPEQATFLFVLDFFVSKENDAPMWVSHMEFDQYYDIEFPLNMLYAKSRKEEEFLRYSAIPVRWWDKVGQILRNKDISKGKLEFNTGHHGKRTINFENVIVIGYDGQNIQVNRENLERFGFHSKIIDKDFPRLPKTPAQYPLRYKIRGFSDTNNHFDQRVLR